MGRSLTHVILAESIPRIQSIYDLTYLPQANVLLVRIPHRVFMWTQRRRGSARFQSSTAGICFATTGTDLQSCTSATAWRLKALSSLFFYIYRRPQRSCIISRRCISHNTLVRCDTSFKTWLKRTKEVRTSYISIHL